MCTEKRQYILWQSLFAHFLHRTVNNKSKLKSVSKLKCGPAHNFMSCLIDLEFFAATGWKTTNICGKHLSTCCFFYHVLNITLQDQQQKERILSRRWKWKEHFCVFMFHIYTRPDTNKSSYLLLFLFWLLQCWLFSAHKQNRKRLLIHDVRWYNSCCRCRLSVCRASYM